jgi:hypothetical protein
MGKTLRDSEDALLKKITVANYRQDPYYARIVKAVEGLLREKGSVASLELFIRMDLLSLESVENWRRGRIAYLERVIRCNLFCQPTSLSSLGGAHARLCPVDAEAA